MNIVSWVSGIFKLKGNTDGSKIGNVDDRLKVAASFNPTPIITTEYKDTTVKNGASQEMNVDGSTTPVLFKYQPGAGETWYVEHLIILLDDSGSSNGFDFGSIAGGLTNGVEIIIYTDSTEHVETTLTSNFDVVMGFFGGQTGSSNGFLDSANAFYGKMLFSTPIRLQGDNGDYIGFKIQDNLTGLNTFRGSVHVWRES